MTAAAEQAGVHRNTIHNWRRNSLPFQHGLAHAQYDRAQFFPEKIEERIDLAFKTLDDTLTDPKTPASTRLKAPPAPKKQIELDIEKIVIMKSPPPTVTEDQLAPAPETASDTSPARNVHKDAQPEIAVNSPSSVANSQPTVHNSAQIPNRREAAKVGRNDACPCGSGKKYKRCCLDKPLAQAA